MDCQLLEKLSGKIGSHSRFHADLPQIQLIFPERICSHTQVTSHNMLLVPKLSLRYIGGAVPRSLALPSFS
jgi:hypothetical protein